MTLLGEVSLANIFWGYVGVCALALAIYQLADWLEYRAIAKRSAQEAQEFWAAGDPVVRPEYHDPRLIVCPHCGLSTLHEDDPFCPACGWHIHWITPNVSELETPEYEPDEPDPEPDNRISGKYRPMDRPPWDQN